MIKHAAIWIDQREARIFHIDGDRIDAATVSAPRMIHHKHPKGPEGAKEHPDDAKRFFRDVRRAIDDTEDVLLVGPSKAKLDFFRYVHKHDRDLESRILGIETVDHPTDGQLIAHARKYFDHSNGLR